MVLRHVSPALIAVMRHGRYRRTTMGIAGRRTKSAALALLFVAGQTTWSPTLLAQRPTSSASALVAATDTSDATWAASEGGVSVHFVADEPGLHLLIGEQDLLGVKVESKHARFDDGCAAPCELKLPTRQYRMALSPPGGDPVEVKDRISLQGRSTLKGHYESHRDLRLFLMISSATAAVAAGVLVGAGLANVRSCSSMVPSSCDDTSSGKLLVAGSFTFLAAIGLAIPLFFVPAGNATIEVVPGPF